MAKPAIALLSALAALFVLFPAGPSLAALEIGTTVKVVNEVHAKNLNRLLKLGEKVVYQETVSTGRESAVDIRLIDESTLIMGELTEIKLDSFVYKPNKGVVEGAIQAVSGIFRFSGSGVKMNVTITTPTATIGVRGTDFDVLTKADATEVSVNEGAVEVTSALGIQRVAQGQVFRVNSAGQGGLQAEPSAEMKQAVSLMLTMVASTDSGGQSSGQTAQQQTPAQTPAQTAALSRAVSGKDNENLLYLQLTTGPLVIELRPDLAPNHVRRIKELARDGVYDDLEFIFVRPGYAAETAIPTGREQSTQTLAAELSDEPFVEGTVAMSHKADDPNSAESQFFITLGRAEALDGKYTVIGKLINGLENAQKLKPGRPPKNPDKIISLTVGPKK